MRAREGHNEVEAPETSARYGRRQTWPACRPPSQQHALGMHAFQELELYLSTTNDHPTSTSKQERNAPQQSQLPQALKAHGHRHEIKATSGADSPRSENFGNSAHKVRNRTLSCPCRSRWEDNA